MLSVLLLMYNLSVSVQSGWTWSVHPESGFKVLSPVELIHEEKLVPTEMDVIRFHQYHGGSVTDSLSPLAFVIDHYLVPTPAEAVDDAYLKDFFENTVDELLTTLDGTLTYMDILHQPGQDVCIWKGKYQKGRGEVRGQCILAGQRYYGLQVFGLEKNKPDAQMTKFLESFRLLNTTSP